MTDTFTDNLNLTLQENGTNNNTWNDKYGSNFEYIDAKLGDRTTINTTGGTSVLTASQERVSVIKVTGTLVSNAVIEFTGVGGLWIVDNATTEDYTVTCMINGQTGVEITQGEKRIVYFDGIDIALAGGFDGGIFVGAGLSIDFGDGDVTITHSTDTLAFAGADSGYSFDNKVEIIKAAGSGADLFHARDSDTGNDLYIYGATGTFGLYSEAGGTGVNFLNLSSSGVVMADGILDFFGSTKGNLLYHDGSTWKVLAPP